MIEVKVGPGRFRGHDFDRGQAPAIDGRGIFDHRLHRELPRQGRELLGHVVRHPGRRGGQGAPDREPQPRLPVRVSIT